MSWKFFDTLGRRRIVSPGRSYKRVTPTITEDYFMSSADEVVLADTSGGGGAIAIWLPSNHSSGQLHSIVDVGGSAATHSITVVSVDADTLSGATGKTISTDYGTLTVVSDGANWLVI